MIDPTRSIRRLATACLFLAACSESTSPPTPDLEIIHLDMRLHLLQSSELDQLDVTLTDTEVGVLIEGLNDVWRQAGVAWRLEQIVREPALNPDAFRAFLSDQSQSATSLVAEVLPTEHLRPDVWNVFLVRDFGGRLGGVYFRSRRVVVGAELDPTGARDLRGGTARILAHELGHSLGLNHAPCTAAGNLMAAGCSGGTRTRLEPEQIEIARHQAELGHPF